MDRRDVLDALTEEELGRERTLDRVAGAGTEVVRVRPLLSSGVSALRQGRVGVGRRDLRDLGRVEDRLRLLGHRRVQRADHADDGVVRRDLGGRVLADVGLGLVVNGDDFELPASDRVGFVGLLDREVDRVLDAQAEGGEVARERRDDADLDGLGAGACRQRSGRVGSAATRGQRQSGHCKWHTEADHGTLLHSSSCENSSASGASSGYPRRPRS